MKIKILTIVMILIAGSVAGCKKKDSVTAQQPQPVEGVRIEEIRTSPLNDYYEAVGTVKAKTTSILSAKVMGGIVSLHVREGDRVSQGQLLMEIDARDANTQLQKAKAGIQEAESALIEVQKSIEVAESAKTAAETQSTLAASTFNRYKAMLEGKAVSQQEFDEVQAKHQIALTEAARAGKMQDVLAARKKQVLAKIDQAKADIANAQIQTSYYRITAPISGIVTVRQADVGFTATPGAPLLTIEDNSHYQLEASVEESQVAMIHTGASASVVLDALGGQEIAGTVAEIIPVADPASRSYKVKIDLQTGVGIPALKSGMYGKARFPVAQKQTLAVPEKAIIQRGQLTGVYVVDESGVARLRLIKTGKKSGDLVEVLGGLSDGERILTGRVEAISDGSRVQ
jgi:multidrug efflux pump subunit AcrA (membrane-fusion protein)